MERKLGFEINEENNSQSDLFQDSYLDNPPNFVYLKLSYL